MRKHIATVRCMLSKGCAHAYENENEIENDSESENELIVGLRVTFYETILRDCAAWTIYVRLTKLKRIRRASTMRGGKGRRISPRYDGSERKRKECKYAFWEVDRRKMENPASTVKHDDVDTVPSITTIVPQVIDIKDEISHPPSSTSMVSVSSLP